MTKWVWKGIKTGIKTSKYPGRAETAAGTSPGRPVNTQFTLEKDAQIFVKRCPADALHSLGNKIIANHEKCIHCFKCKHKAFSESDTDSAFINWQDGYEWAEYDEKGSPLPNSSFSGSLHIRIVDAGACGACMSEIKQISTPYYNIHRLGFFITPTPRMADILLIAGPLTEHMTYSVQKTWEAMPSPKKVIAVGTCAISGGVFGTGFAVKGGIRDTIPVDIRVPGCPPPPLAIVHALLMAAGKKIAPAAELTKDRR